MLKTTTAALLLALAACGGPPMPPKALPGSSDTGFKEVADHFLARYLELFPTDATQLGEHKYDGKWPDRGPEGVNALRAFVADTRADLARIDPAGLTDNARIDRAMIEYQMAFITYQLDRVQALAMEPLYYIQVIGDGLDPLITRDFAPHDVRMESLRQRLEGLPALVAAAKANLQKPAKVATETAIQQVQGLIGLVEGLEPEIAKEPAKKAELTKAAATGAAALKDLAAFLKGDLLARSSSSFRKGPDNFREALRVSLGAETPPDELYADARTLLSKTQDEMVATALELWPELFPGQPVPAAPTDHAEKMKLVKAALDKVAEDRPTNVTIIDDMKQVIGKATEFVRAKDLMGVPSDTLKVIVMPEYKRGVAVAYCESSGPLEAKQETKVEIAPTPADWPAARVESFYRENNRAMLAELAIHEAMPGHYLQAMHANRDKDVVRAVFGSGAFAEGWAVYGEWLMAKNGFGGARVRLQRQKMVLRLATNAILDHDVHAGKLQREEALKLMQEEALQEEGEAVGKWRRAQLTCGQLSTYFYGFREIMKVREAAEAKPGFAEKAFNDKLLSFGSPPPRFLAHLVLGDPL